MTVKTHGESSPTLRSHLHSLLSGIYLEEPSEALLEWVESAPIPAFFKPGLLPLDRLRNEYARLFLGSTPAFQPLGRLWDGEAKKKGGAISIPVIENYRKAGYELPASHREIPDHLGVELEFLAHLTQEEDKARRREDVERFSHILEAEQAFLHDCLLPWAPEYCRKVETCTTCDFYRKMASLTIAFLQWEEDEVQAGLLKARNLRKRRKTGKEGAFS